MRFNPFYAKQADLSLGGTHIYKTRGLTLTEVIIAVAIMGLIVAAAVGGFASYAERQAFNQFVNDITLSIKEQRKRTLASVESQQYGVHISSTTVSYFEGAAYSTTSVTSKVDIPNNISATSSLSSGETYITFARLTGEASATGTIVFDDSRSGSTATITINALGLVE